MPCEKLILSTVGRLAGGYDLVTPAMIETPDFFLKTLYMGTQEDPSIAKAGLTRVRKLADEWKSTFPEEKHAEFEEIPMSVDVFS
jgi:hypothetical protein